MPSVSATRLKAIIDREARPLLRQAGFKTRRNYFVREDPGSTALISVQSSQWNTPDAASFTINVCRYYPRIAIESGATPSDPTGSGLFWGEHLPIGHLLPDGGDHWWRATSDDAVPTLASEVALAIREYALPHLERIASIEGFAEHGARYFARRERLDTLPIVTALRLAGRTDEARLIYRRITSRAPPDGGVVGEWAKANSALAG